MMRPSLTTARVGFCGQTQPVYQQDDQSTGTHAQQGASSVRPVRPLALAERMEALRDAASTITPARLGELFGLPVPQTDGLVSREQARQTWLAHAEHPAYIAIHHHLDDLLEALAQLDVPQALQDETRTTLKPYLSLLSSTGPLDLIWPEAKLNLCTALKAARESSLQVNTAAAVIQNRDIPRAQALDLDFSKINLYAPTLGLSLPGYHVALDLLEDRPVPQPHQAALQTELSSSASALDWQSISSPLTRELTRQALKALQKGQKPPLSSEELHSVRTVLTRQSLVLASEQYDRRYQAAEEAKNHFENTLNDWWKAFQPAQQRAQAHLTTLTEHLQEHYQA